MATTKGLKTVTITPQLNNQLKALKKELEHTSVQQTIEYLLLSIKPKK